MANKLGRLLTLGRIFSTQRLSRHRLLVAIEIWRKHYTDFEIQKALQISITKFQVMWAFGTHVASIDYIACRIIMQPFYNFDIIFINLLTLILKLEFVAGFKWRQSLQEIFVNEKEFAWISVFLKFYNNFWRSEQNI